MGATAAQNRFGSDMGTTQVYSHEWIEFNLLQLLPPSFYSTGISTQRDPPDWESCHRWAYSLAVGDTFSCKKSVLGPDKQKTAKWIQKTGAFVGDFLAVVPGVIRSRMGLGLDQRGEGTDIWETRSALFYMADSQIVQTKGGLTKRNPKEKRNFLYLQSFTLWFSLSGITNLGGDRE